MLPVLTTRRVHATMLTRCGTGVGWANAALKFQKQQPLYCEPEGLALTAEQAIDIIRKEVAARPASASFHGPL
jgi:hypothetical protein